MAWALKTDEMPPLEEKYQRLAVAVSERVMRIVVARQESDVKALTPAGVGGQAGLRGSINGQTATYGALVTGMVGTPQEYGAAVEYGTRPHFPPIDPIELWVRRILGVPADKARNVAYAIAVNISRHGTKGAGMFQKAFANNETWINRMMDSIPVQVAREGEKI